MKNYHIAKEMYSQIGIDTECALNKLSDISISMHCWQGDDVAGFENKIGATGGIQATGNYIGKARTPDELRADFKKAISLIPGKKRINLHAIYAETDGTASRNNIEPKHMNNWLLFAKDNDLGIDFNPTCFSHKMAESGFTLSSNEKGIRDFWIEHCIACREISEYMGKALDDKVVTNIWIPDGFKDTPIDRYAPRRHLENSLDLILKKPMKYNVDAVESKLFGIGSEACVIGSHEFYMGYAVKNQTYLTLDSGHFHPTETVSNKITGIVDFVPGILLHTSRPIRWDSDHIVVLDDELQLLFAEISRNNLFDKVAIGLDYFDASINRIAAWIIGMRNTQKAILMSLLEPTDTLRKFEIDGNYTARIAYLEELKSLPWQLVWDEYCERNDVPVGISWLSEVIKYEKEVLAKRI